jgi:hypothetical protein
LIEALLKLQRKIIVTFVGCNLYVSESLTKNNTCGDDGINGNTDGPWEIPSGVQKYTFSELAKATGNFSEANEIGAGGFGKVFYGTLDDGKIVAIKRASQQSLQGTTEFRNEVLLLSRLHHRHLVRLEGFCDDKGLQVLAGILYIIFNMHPVRISFPMFDMLFLFHSFQFLTYLRVINMGVMSPQILVYEFMSKGNLHDHLLGEDISVTY